MATVERSPDTDVDGSGVDALLRRAGLFGARLDEDTPAVGPEPGHEQYVVGLALICLLGAAFRLLPALGSPGPLGDGGMFYVMVQELWKHHFVPPMYTSYNGAHIPFAYPPLGFVIAGILHGLTGATWMSIFHYLPPVLACLTVPAFLLLAREMLESRAAILAATFVFAVSASSFEWEIKGGGITRAVGLLFALLALQQAVALYRRAQRRHLLPAILFSGLTVLSHLEWTWFLAVSLVVLVSVYGRSRRALIDTCLLGLGIAALAAPWLIMDLSRYGVAPFLEAMGGSEAALPWYRRLLDFLFFNLQVAPGFSISTALALVGVMVCIVRRNAVFPLWLAAAYLSTSRGPADKVIVPLALLAGFGFQSAALPFVVSALDRLTKAWRVSLRTLCVVVGLQVLMSGVLATTLAESSLSPSELATISWVRTHTPPRSPILVVSNALWGEDYASEWLPALTGRRSVANVQGFEWLPGQFTKRLKRYDALQKCEWRTSTCLDRWIAQSSPRPTFVIVPADSATCCTELVQWMERDPEYRLRFQVKQMDIFQVVRRV